jgi:hypothetical protein
MQSFFFSTNISCIFNLYHAMSWALGLSCEEGRLPPDLAELVLLFFVVVGYCCLASGFIDVVVWWSWCLNSGLCV